MMKWLSEYISAAIWGICRRHEICQRRGAVRQLGQVRGGAQSDWVVGSCQAERSGSIERGSLTSGQQGSGYI